MELPANIQISDGPTYAMGLWRPGVLRCDGDGLGFVERGKDTLESLATGDMASVCITTHLLGADDVVVTTRKGGAWSIKVKGGVKLVDALRTLGVIVKPQS